MTNKKFIKKFYKSKKAREFVSYISESWFFFVREGIYAEEFGNFDAFLTDQLRCFGHNRFKAQMIYFIALNPTIIDDNLKNYLPF